MLEIRCQNNPSHAPRLPASFFKAPETLEAHETPETPETPETLETPVEKHDFKELGAKIMIRWVCVNDKRVK